MYGNKKEKRFACYYLVKKKRKMGVFLLHRGERGTNLYGSPFPSLHFPRSPLSPTLSPTHLSRGRGQDGENVSLCVCVDDAIAGRGEYKKQQGLIFLFKLSPIPPFILSLLLVSRGKKENKDTETSFRREQQRRQWQPRHHRPSGRSGRHQR